METIMKIHITQAEFFALGHQSDWSERRAYQGFFGTTKPLHSKVSYRRPVDCKFNLTVKV